MAASSVEASREQLSADHASELRMKDEMIIQLEEVDLIKESITY